MLQGQMKTVAYALYRIAEVEEAINHVEVWNAIGEDGIENVRKLQTAINVLANMLVEGTEHNKLKGETT